MAETPRLYAPAWMDDIMEKSPRTLRNDLAWPDDLVQRWESAIRQNFED